MAKSCRRSSNVQGLSESGSNLLIIVPFRITCMYEWQTGLGTVFFSVQNVPFFPVLLKNVPFFSVFLLSFWRPMGPKRTLRSFPYFSKEWKRAQRTQRSFAKNVKQCQNVLFF